MVGAKCIIKEIVSIQRRKKWLIPNHTQKWRCVDFKYWVLGIKTINMFVANEPVVNAARVSAASCIVGAGKFNVLTTTKNNSACCVCKFFLYVKCFEFKNL